MIELVSCVQRLLHFVLLSYTMARLRVSGGGSRGAPKDDARAIKTHLFEKLGSLADEASQLLGAL